MSGGPMRLPQGGLVARERPLSFTFDGRALTGLEGDTLASALVANGVRLVGRSFKYHRPRGLLTAGSEEPNGLITVGGAPNLRATMVALREGLAAHSQNRWPSLRRDAMAVNDLFAPLLGAGFYYKTFMWPAAFWEAVYEPLIRRAAGLGRLTGQPPAHGADRAFAHCDLLVIGAGPAGLMAALTAGGAGVRVILADEDARPGGRLLAEREEIGGDAGHAWAAGVAAELAALPNVRLMARTTVFGAYDGGVHGALQRGEDDDRDTYWRIHARHAILAAGATERPIAFPGNDRPGVMLAGAMRAYLNRWAALAGRRVVLFAACDDAWRTAADMAAEGVEVVIVDPREDGLPPAPKSARVIMGGAVVATRGRLALRAVRVRHARGTEEWIAADALAVSGGFNPNLQLTCHHRGRPIWRDDVNAFVPGPDLPPGMAVAGAAAGVFGTRAALEDGAAAGAQAAQALGRQTPAPDIPAAQDRATGGRAFWHVQAKGRAFVDFQHDVTTKDVAAAQAEGFGAVEHMKRYTTLGMATDQGRVGAVLALGVAAEFSGVAIAQAGTTIFRPPYTPVPLAALAGWAPDRPFRPTRLTPTHDWAAARGAVFVEVGQWLRTQYFVQPGETHWRESVDREALAVRAAVGFCDVSTLGKIDVQGPDAAAFLDRLYCNPMLKVAVGRCRYGVMLREDGHVFDDGTVARLAEDHFVVTTTTANAAVVMRHMSFCRDGLWPDMDVALTSATEQWAQVAVSGPRARALIARVVEAIDLSDAAFPYMACGAARFMGARARVFRLSYSGELGFEIAVPARLGAALAQALNDAGAEMGATAYGTEALGVLRIEKGHVAGAELDGRTTPADLGLGRMVSGKKDFIGATLLRRPGLSDPDRPALVGLTPVDPAAAINGGAQLVAVDALADAAHAEGWVTSAAFSPHLRSPVALGLLRGGAARIGQRLRAVDPVRGRDTICVVTDPCFIDPDGGRLRV